MFFSFKFKIIAAVAVGIKKHKSQITHTCWIVIDCCEFSGTYCKISETHFRVLEEWYGYLENVVE